jgi:hypothetical protein
VEKADAILGLKKDIIYSIIKNSGRNEGGKGYGNGSGRGKSPVSRGFRSALPTGTFRESPEEVVLTSLIQYPELADHLTEDEVATLFRDEILKSLTRKVMDEIRAGGAMDGAAFLGHLNEKEKAVFSRLMVRGGGISLSSGQARKAFFDGMNGLYQRRYKAELEALDRQMREREKSGDFEETVTLLRRRKAIVKSYQRMLHSNLKSR